MYAAAVDPTLAVAGRNMAQQLLIFGKTQVIQEYSRK
jgi:hypothetical protein